MTNHTTTAPPGARPSRIRSWPMLALGSFFAGLTGWTLLAEVVAGAEPLTPAHVGSAGAILAAVASGHAAWPQLRRGAVMPALGLIAIFLAATAYVIVASAARNAETGAAKAARIAAANALRTGEERQLRLAEEMHANVSARLKAGCVDKILETAKVCDGYRASIAVYAAAIKGHRAELRALPPVIATNGYAHAARTLAALPGITAAPDAIEERLTLVLPFLVVIISELATIVFLNLGLPSGEARAVRTVRVESSGAPARPGLSGPAPLRPRPSVCPAPKERDAALAELLTDLGLGKSIPSQQALAERWHRPKQTVSDWFRAWEAAGTIPVRRRTGRTSTIA